MPIMSTSLHELIEPARGVNVRRTVDLLRRYAQIERDGIRALAEWFLRTPRVETKIGLGYQLWAHAERAHDLRQRLVELRGGHHEANMDPALARLGEELRAAPDADAFLAGWSLVIGHLADAYDRHLQQADGSANAQEVRVLRRLSSDARHSLNWAQKLDAPRSPQTEPWRQHVSALLASAGGVAGQEPRPADVPRSTAPRPADPLPYVFDERIEPGRFADYRDRINLSPAECRIAEMEIFFNEFYAAGLLATVIIDSWGATPWDFVFDMSHHFWDEVRHAEFGLIRLRELGIEPRRVDLTLFDAARTMPFLHRLCYLTLGLEVYFMPRKKPRYERYGTLGDQRTQLFADVDWSDEGNHVHYGKRWVEHFLRDDARDVKALQDEIHEHLRASGAIVEGGPPAPF
jgi:hypothetical protein